MSSAVLAALPRVGSARLALRQVRDLAALRWSTTSGRARVAVVVGLVVLVAPLPVLCLLAATTTDALPDEVRTQVVELLGPAHLVLVVGLLTSAVVSAGGRELVPRAHLVAYPVAPATEHACALLLTPLNLAWWAQVGGLAVVTSSAVGIEATRTGTDLVPALLGGLALTACWAAALTAAGQLLTWAVELVRTAPGGRWWLRGALAAAALVTALTVDADALVALLDSRPSRLLAGWVGGPATGTWAPTAWAALVLLAVSAVLVVAGAVVHGVLTRRPSRDQARQETRRHHARALPEGPGAALRSWHRADWGVVRRSPPLRRGFLVLLLAPVAGGLLARIGPADVVLLTAVVAAGAGLLFGVNAFCLDGEGAVWRASLPVPPRTWLLARGLVLAEVVLVTTVPATAAALVGADGPLTATTLTAVVAGTLAMTGQVVARCLRWSVARPEHAPMRTVRDSPAPPGRMAVLSAQLVLGTVVLGVLLSVVGRTGSPLWPVVVVLPSLALSTLSLLRTARRWEDPAVRSHVVQTVSRG